MTSPALVRYYFKGVLANRHIWLWGIAFAFFWLIMGAFAMSQTVPSNTDAWVETTSSWFGVVALFSLSSIAVSMAYTIHCASSSLSYSFRYTKLTPRTLVATLVSSSSLLGMILSAVVMTATFVFFSVHFSSSIAPGNIIGGILVAALAGMFMMAFAIMLMLVAVNYLGARSITPIMLIPMLLAFWLGTVQVDSNMPLAAIYISPYNAIQSLLYASYSGTNVYAQLYNPATPVLDWTWLLVSLVAWTVGLIVIDVFLLRRLKPRPIEEGRQI